MAINCVHLRISENVIFLLNIKLGIISNPDISVNNATLFWVVSARA